MSLLALCAMAPGLAWGQDGEAPDAKARPYRVTGHAELGFLTVLDHTVQFSEDGTEFDYATEGGQDTLFAVGRLSLDVALGESRRHIVTFLYQPLELETRVVLPRDVSVDGLTFPQDTPVVLTYGFPFYRASYMYDLVEGRHELAVGGGLQLRNASITFASVDGTLLRSNRDVGPVPLFKVRGAYRWTSGFWVGTEVDGIYAPISYINGSDSDVEGALLDASVRAGVRLEGLTDLFVNVRYLAGGAKGTSSDPDPPNDGFSSNWLDFATVTLGVSKTLR